MAWVLRVLGVPVLSLGCEPEDGPDEYEELAEVPDVIALPGDLLPARPTTTGLGFAPPAVDWDYPDE